MSQSLLDQKIMNDVLSLYEHFGVSISEMTGCTLLNQREDWSVRLGDIEARKKELERTTALVAGVISRLDRQIEDVDALHEVIERQWKEIDELRSVLAELDTEGLIKIPPVADRPSIEEDKKTKFSDLGAIVNDLGLEIENLGEQIEALNDEQPEHEFALQLTILEEEADAKEGARQEVADFLYNKLGKQYYEEVSGEPQKYTIYFDNTETFAQSLSEAINSLDPMRRVNRGTGSGRRA